MSKWKGIKFKSDYRPQRFNHRNRSYEWSKLTREEIEVLAADPKFGLFHFNQKFIEREPSENVSDAESEKVE